MVFLTIFNFLRKYWFIFALVAVYILIAGLNILPRGLNIFKKQHLMIDETPIVVKEIKEIGELTTSEFYGEVYADLNEVYAEMLDEKGDSIRRNPAKFYEDYPGLKGYLADIQDFRGTELFYESESKNYELFLSDYYKTLEDYRLQEAELKDKISTTNSSSERKKLQRRLSALKDQTVEQKKTYLKRKETFNANEKRFREQKNNFRDERKKRNLVYIGRGWVKAGVNFKDISDEEIFIDDSDSLYIHVLIPEPKILDADVNPWFVYTKKKKIKGFELFIAKTGSMLSRDNFTDKEINAVKHKCKEKLQEAAIEKGLLVNAKSSAQTTLGNFFHLLGFEKVKINFKTENAELVLNE